MGYAFVNFLEPQDAERCSEVFHNYVFQRYRKDGAEMGWDSRGNRSRTRYCGVYDPWVFIGASLGILGDEITHKYPIL